MEFLEFGTYGIIKMKWKLLLRKRIMSNTREVTIKWDEETIALHDKDRGSRQKVN